MSPASEVDRSQSNVRCVVCGQAKPAADAVESAAVRSNVRRFRDETFHVWRCPTCRSIHAVEDVDLDLYYRSYPIFSGGLEPRMYPAFEGLLERLTDAGLRPEHRILDYGCGSGLFLEFLKLRGYTGAVGYDAHVERFRDPSLLSRTYDCVMSQDVLEHVDDPLALLRTFGALVEPGGLVVIGTPDAEAIDLRDPGDFVHTLHAPFHRHILASTAVQKAAATLGWELLRFYPTMYGNRLIPGQNPRFGLHYLRCFDDCLDLLTEPVRVNSWRFWTPATPFYALFGFFLDRHTDVTFCFRTPAPRSPGG